MTSWTNDYIARLQIPAPGALNLDHLTYFVPDHDAADKALVRLGFNPTPFSSHVHRDSPGGAARPAGGGNHCVMLRRGYLGFLTPSGDTPLAKSLRDSIKRYVGAHSMLIGAADAETEYERLKAAGFNPHPIAAMERAVGTPDGERPMRTARLAVDSSSHGGLQIVQQKTPELLWQQRWLDHRNRAFGLAAALYCVADPAGTAVNYSKLMGIAVSGGKVPRIVTSRGEIVFLAPDTVRRVLKVDPPADPWIAGPVLECSDTIAPRSLFEMNDIETNDLGHGRFSAALPPALGGIVVFGPIGRAVPDFSA
jgi:hypothetical protein